MESLDNPLWLPVCVIALLLAIAVRLILENRYSGGSSGGDPPYRGNQAKPPTGHQRHPDELVSPDELPDYMQRYMRDRTHPDSGSNRN